MVPPTTPSKVHSPPPTHQTVVVVVHLVSQIWSCWQMQQIIQQPKLLYLSQNNNLCSCWYFSNSRWTTYHRYTLPDGWPPGNPVWQNTGQHCTGWHTSCSGRPAWRDTHCYSDIQHWSLKVEKIRIFVKRWIVLTEFWLLVLGEAFKKKLWKIYIFLLFLEGCS